MISVGILRLIRRFITVACASFPAITAYCFKATVLKRLEGSLQNSQIDLLLRISEDFQYDTAHDGGRKGMPSRTLLILADTLQRSLAVSLTLLPDFIFINI